MIPFLLLRGKRLFVLCCVLCCLAKANAQTLSAGDIVMTGWNTYTNTVSFVALATIPSGTVIKITDYGWNNSTQQWTGTATGDGVITWTAGSTFPAGTLFSMRFQQKNSDPLSGPRLANNSTGDSLNSQITAVVGYTVTDPITNTGDGVFFYQGPDNNPFFIYGFNNTNDGAVDATGWNTVVSMSLRDSNFPDGNGSQNTLTKGTTAVGMTGGAGFQRNVQYNGPVTVADKATWLARLNNSSNWTGDNTSPGSTTNGISTTSTTLNINAAPVFARTSPTTLSYCANGGVVNVNALLKGYDANTGQTLTWSVTTAPAHSTLGGFPYSTTSTGDSVTPAGLTLTPAAGYSGSDAFVINISDGTLSNSLTVDVTVNATPAVAAITGTNTVCVGATTQLANATSGGSWSSSNTANATVSSTGLVTGVAAGTATITYTYSNGTCTNTATTTVTVNALPAVAAITGTTSVCEALTTQLADATAGGSWSSSNTGVATVDASGLVTGVAAGTATITYTFNNGTCSNTATASVTVNALPAVAAIMGTTTVCTGLTTQLADATTGGSWSSNNTAVATVDASGLVTAVTAGTTTITYTFNNGTCSNTATATVTVNTTPAVAAITGTTTVCEGLTTQLSNATTGGSWSSSNTAVATIDASGLVTGVAAGTTTITYTFNNGTCTNTATTTVTVNALPAVAAITGTTTVCTGLTTQLADATAGGSWSSSNTAVATADASGLVTGVTAGTATITYTYSNGTCSNTATATVTVYETPVVAAITGTTAVCEGLTTQLADATAGGSWSSSNTAAATIDASGLVTGVLAGTTTITYTYNNGSCTNTATTTVTVNALPTVAAITGTTSVCEGVTTQLADATAGGSWSSSNTAVATIDASGLVTGVAAGTATITYVYNNGTCSNTATRTLTVNALPVVAAVTGTTSVCEGLTTQLADATAGGSWSSSNTAVATIDASGLVTGVSAGTATITYTYNNGTCTNTATTTVTVNALPTVAAITGTTSVCEGVTTQLADATAGGSWSSSNTAVATIDASGLVTGVAAGTATITYTYNNGTCSNTATTTVTVNALPVVAAVTGTTSVCEGLTTQLADATAGGSWSSSNTAVATIDASGLVTGVSAGTSTITYTYNNGTCSNTATTSVTVNALPAVAAITGTTTVCEGLTTQLSDATAGGSWSSDNTAVATVDAIGLVTGVSAGTATITYTYNNGTCSNTATVSVTVNALPVVAAITGTASVCEGLITQLSDATAGGSWSSSNTAAATIDASGLVTGVAAGTSTITYTYNNGTCSNTATTTVTVNALPAVAAITGTTSVCAGATTQLSDATTGGSWSSDNTAIATVDASGLVTGVSSGTATITYTYNNGTCSNTATAGVTVNALPVVAAITGTTSVCAGLTTQLADATAGGSWSSSNTAVATVDASGLVTGVSSGTATITYTYNNGTCTNTATATVTVNALPVVAAITGTTSVCAGLTTQLSDATTGGSWSSSNTAVATIDASGLVTAITAGTITITYTYNNGTCSNTATTSVTVNALPAIAAITGTTTVCAGVTTQLSNATAGGSWSSSNTAVATVDAGGLVTGVSSGTATITYTYNNGTCSNTATASVTVNATPVVAAITGTTSVCAGLTTQLADATAGGSWSSSNTAVATVDASGSVTGVSAGTVTITYTYNNGTCSNTATATITVNALPVVAAITGTTSVCAGLTTQLADATAGGNWSSSNTAVATVDAGGLVTGVSAGTVTITYTYNNGTCSNIATAALTVNALPVVAAITGTTSVCAGLTTQLANATAGGSWSSGNTAVATVNASSGLVTGVAAGTAVITYTYNNGTCSNSAATTITVNALPALAAITGTTNVCTGLTTQLANATIGGSWNSSNTAVAAVNSSTGLVTGVSAGTATITYTYSNGTCSNTATATVTVNNTPATPVITPGGALSFCLGSGVTLTSSSATGNQWFNNGIAIPGATGSTYAATASGIYTVRVTNASGCSAVSASQIVVVFTLPTAIVTVSGPLGICVGGNVVLTSASTTGNQWYLNGTAISGATAQSYTASAAGSYSLTVTNSSGCTATSLPFVVTVNPLPVLTVTSAANSISKGDVTRLTVTSSTTIATASWTPTALLDFPLSTTPTARLFETTQYTVTVTDIAGCKATGNVTIQVVEDFKLTPRVIITPNGDGINDKFIIDNIDAYPDNTLRIFDRSGKLIYEKENYRNDWEGRTGLRAFQDDTYFYVLTVKGRIIKKGTITLVR